MASRGDHVARRLLRSLIGGRLLGAVDYLRFPGFATEYGGPLNSQPRRQALVQALIARLGPAAIVETGTFRGTTTEFLAATGLPVFTVEKDPRHYGFARMRLRGRRNVTVRQGDSRAALRAWLDGPLSSLRDRPLFFYLDAHWYGDLPLADELEIIFTRCTNATVMIDDFRVPDDPGYGYDGEAMTTEALQPVIAASGLCVFYPSARSSEEAGARRGCVILAKRAGHAPALASVELVRA
jgi:hypothetical protein